MVQRVPGRGYDSVLTEEFNRIFEDNSGLDFATASVKALEEAESPEQTDSSKVLTHRRSEFNARLRAISPDQKYHNGPSDEETAHAVEVFETIKRYLENTKLQFSDLEKILIQLAALRHDDDHVGQTYRQLADNLEFGSNLSNEEMACLILIIEFKNVLSLGDLITVVQYILRTSFGQDAQGLGFNNISEEQRPRLQRDYKAETIQQKMLRLADIGYFEKGWEHFKQRSIDLYLEKKEVIDFETWKNKNLGFINFVIQPLLDEVKEHFNETYAAELEAKLRECIDALNNISPAEQAKIEAALPQAA